MGIWRGKSWSPSATYQIEFTVLDKLELGRNALLTDYRRFSLSTIEDAVAMTAFVEGVDVEEETTAYLRLGSDCILMAEIAPRTIVPGSWVRLHVPAHQLELWPYDTGAFKVIERLG